MSLEQVRNLPEPVQRLLCYWADACSNDTAPIGAALNPAKLREWMSDISIIEFHEGDRNLCLRMQGLNVTRNIGDYYAIGGYLEDIVPDDVQSVVLEPYFQAHRTRRPIYSVIPRGLLKGSFDQFERLILPFIDEATGEVDRFITWVGPTNRNALDCETIYATPLSDISPSSDDACDSELVVIN